MARLVIEGTNTDDENWEPLTDEVTELMLKATKGRVHSDFWSAKVNNFGWRHLNGSKNFRAKNGEELLLKVLPDAMCSFRIYFDSRTNTITINNAHHDAPMGGEMYYIRPMSESNVSRFLNGWLE